MIMMKAVSVAVLGLSTAVTAFAAQAPAATQRCVLRINLRV